MAVLKERLHNYTMRGTFTADPAVVVEHCVKAGDPAAEILATARETESDMIVMGTMAAPGWPGC